MFAPYVGLEELVLLGDAMMRRDADQRWLSLDDFHAAVEAFERHLADKKMHAPRGFDNCRRALQLMSEETDSPAETHARLLLESYGLPRPEINAPVDVRDERGVTRRFYLDMAFPQWGVAVEYDGRHHAGSWESDQHRLKLLADDGWMTVSVIWDDLIDDQRRQGVANSVAERIAQRGGRVTLLRQPMSLRELTDRRRLRMPSEDAG